MNPRRKRKTFEIWENRPVPQPSGTKKDNWVNTEETVKVSMYDQSSQNQLTTGSTGVRIKQYDILGLTSLKTLRADENRLKCGDEVYCIKGVNNEGRLAQLFMEVWENAR